MNARGGETNADVTLRQQPTATIESETFQTPMTSLPPITATNGEGSTFSFQPRTKAPHGNFRARFGNFAFAGDMQRTRWSRSRTILMKNARNPAGVAS